MSSENTALTEQESAWVQEVAGRLRLIQSDTARAEPEQRREFLQEELERNFKQVASGNRKRFLGALLTRFPVAGHVATGRSAPAPPPPAAPPPPRRETLDEICERLIQELAGMAETEPQRARITQRLMEGGLIQPQPQPQSQAEPDLEVLRKWLNVPEEQPLRLKSVVELCALLIAKFDALDQAALQAVRELSKGSSLARRQSSFPQAAAQFVSGSIPSLESALGLVVDFLDAFLKAPARGSGDFLTQHVGQLSPSEIEGVVRAEQGDSMFKDKQKARCWDKYSSLVENETREVVEQRIRASMIAFMEREMDKKRRSGR